MSFANLGLSQELLTALEEQKYINPYPIQNEAIPAILKGGDVLGIAQTGSGKTASFVLPLLMNLKGKTASRNRHVKALILVPTRELALQIQEVVYQFSKGLSEPMKSLAVYGGVSINPQMKALQNVQILVATPGRLLELIDSNAVSLSSVKMLILDEADKLLNRNFKEEFDKIVSFLPKKRQNLLFSATLSDKVKEINQVLLHTPHVIKIEQEEKDIDLIQQLAYAVSEEKKGPLLRYLIKSKGLEQVLVFTSSTYKADNVADKLRKNGVEASSMHGKKSQKKRTDALRDFKAGTLRVLVTTDLLSRGIDIEFLPCVINYELPRSPKDYIHRIGRTGRAENAGEAISLISPDAEKHFKVIQKKMRTWVELLDSRELNLHGF